MTKIRPGTGQDTRAAIWRDPSQLLKELSASTRGSGLADPKVDCTGSRKRPIEMGAKSRRVSTILHDMRQEPHRRAVTSGPGSTAIVRSRVKLDPSFLPRAKFVL